MPERGRRGLSSFNLVCLAWVFFRRRHQVLGGPRRGCRGYGIASPALALFAAVVRDRSWFQRRLEARSTLLEYAPETNRVAVGVAMMVVVARWRPISSMPSSISGSNVRRATGILLAGCLAVAFGVGFAFARRVIRPREQDSTADGRRLPAERGRLAPGGPRAARVLVRGFERAAECSFRHARKLQSDGRDQH